MLFTSSSAGDIEKYFRNTYTKFKDFGDKLFYIQKVNGEKVSGLDEDQEEFDLLLADDYPYEVDYVLPNRAVFQYKSSCFLLQRIPARQYKRGLCNDNVQIVETSSGEKRPLDFDVLKAFVTKQKYFTFTEAISKKGKCKAYALNSRMSFVAANGTVLCDLKKIGFCGDGKLYIHPLFIPEITRQLAENQETITVVPHVV